MTREVESDDDGRNAAGGDGSEPPAGEGPIRRPIPGKDPAEDDGKGAVQSPLAELARFSGHGLTFAVATGLFLLAGWWVDGWLGTTPIFTIIGAFVGAGAGFYSMLQHLVLLPRQRERERDEVP